jgi:hypothetical protein
MDGTLTDLATYWNEHLSSVQLKDITWLEQNSIAVRIVDADDWTTTTFYLTPYEGQWYLTIQENIDNCSA